MVSVLTQRAHSPRRIFITVTEVKSFGSMNPEVEQFLNDVTNLNPLTFLWKCENILERSHKAIIVNKSNGTPMGTPYSKFDGTPEAVLRSMCVRVLAFN